MAKPKKEKPADDPKIGVVTRSTKLSAALGVLAAMALFGLVNVMSARHYKRIDYTTSKLYTLSDATVQTLRSLESTVTIEILLSPADPLSGSIRNLLVVYGGETTRLDVHYVDPDRHPADFVAVQQKYNIVAGRTEDQKVVTDAAIVVAKGDKHWFLTSNDLVDLSEAGEGKSRSKMEQALTGAIRSVLGGERMHICFSSGHGEFSIEDRGPQGLSEFNERLEKNNYDTEMVDATKPDAKDTFKNCDVLAVVGPSQTLPRPEADAILARMKAGMGGIFMIGPMLDPDKKSQIPSGLEPVTEAFGISLPTDFVFETDDKKRVPNGYGEVFLPDLKPHPVTEGLLQAASSGLRIVLFRSRSLGIADGSAKAPAVLLATSADAFGMTDFFGWIEKGGPPEKKATDHKGPLSVAMAAELPVPSGSNTAHGPRLVVIGSASPALGQNWRDSGLRGTALFTENVVSWVGARPPILDVPTREAALAGLRITEDSLGEIFRYVMLFMPGAALLLAISVYLRRGSGLKPHNSSPKAK